MIQVPSYLHASLWCICLPELYSRRRREEVLQTYLVDYYESVTCWILFADGQVGC